MAYTFKDINKDKTYLDAKQKADQYAEYKESDNIKTLYNNANDIYQNKRPADWDADLMSKGKVEAWDKIANRPDFSYDINGDALYQQYKDQYINQGRLAMMDTMGQAAAMTGGYGNSYASAVGNQAYQGYLQKLNEVVPDLYNMAYNMYLQEGEDLKYAYDVARDEYNTKYAENQDAFSRWDADVNTAYGIASNESTREQGIWGLNNKATSDVLDRVIGMFNTKEANNFAADQQKTQESQWTQSHNLEKQKLAAQKEANKIASAAKSGGMTKEMTAAEIADQLQGYKDSKDNVGLAAFLDILEADGIISEKDSDSYYSKYFTKSTTPTRSARDNPFLYMIN